MNCRAFEKELLAHPKGSELGIEARLHADSCVHCRLLAQAQQALFDAVAEEKQARVPPFLSTRVMAGLPKPEARVGHMTVWQQALQVAAVLLALMGGFTGSVLMGERADSEDFTVVSSDYFLTGETGLTIEEGWLYSETYEQ